MGENARILRKAAYGLASHGTATRGTLGHSSLLRLKRLERDVREIGSVGYNCTRLSEHGEAARNGQIRHCYRCRRIYSQSAVSGGARQSRTGLENHRYRKKRGIAARINNVQLAPDTPVA